MKGSSNPGTIIIPQIIGKSSSITKKKTSLKHWFSIYFVDSKLLMKIMNPNISPLSMLIDAAKNRNKLNINGKRRRKINILNIEQKTKDAPYLSGIR